MRFAQAHRASRAKRIILDAYRTRPNASRADIVRYYLIGESVAVAVVADAGPPRQATTVLVARAAIAPGRRAVRLHADNRAGLFDWRALVAHVEHLHAKYGSPLPPVGGGVHSQAAAP